jgi:hypothetical protein
VIRTVVDCPWCVAGRLADDLCAECDGEGIVEVEHACAVCLRADCDGCASSATGEDFVLPFRDGPGAAGGGG